VASISFDHVSKSYGKDTAAVRDLSLVVQDTEFMVLVGPSGCGKSTALRMIAGLETITAGEIKIGERVINDIPAQERDIAMVFQSYALYPHMTVYKNMAFGLKMRGTKKNDIESRVREAARILSLEDVLNRKPRQLSGGQRQRVALGRAIVRHPQVFLLDEPLSNLDAKLRVQTRLELQRLHRRLRATFIYVTHDQVEAMTMGERIAVMKDGRLQQVASPHDLYNKPVNLFVAGFIGSPAMNFVPATVSGTTATAAGFQIDLPKPPGIEKVLLGIRPEAFDFRGTEAEPTLTLTVDVVELLGSDQFAYGTAGIDLITARLGPDIAVGPGDRIPLRVDPIRVHVFDPTSEMRIDMVSSRPAPEVSSDRREPLT
jgi:multiple sugar transport system ATP-binding protein